MSILSTLYESPAPAAAVEIAANRVSAASLERRGAQAVVSAHASESLPEGAVTPALTGTNIHDRASVLGALNRVLEQIGRPRRVGLVVPDVIARVSLLKFARLPPRAQDLDQLVRWQVKKGLPFPIDDAQVSYVSAMRADDGHEFLVSLARRDVVLEYEGLCAEAGSHAGIVDLATLNVVNAVLAGANPPAADWLLVNVAGGYTSIALLRGRDIIFFRNRAADTEGTLADLVHQTAMYYEDRLTGAGLSRVMLAGAAAAEAGQVLEIDQIRRSLEERLHTAVDTVDPRAGAALTDRIAAAPALLDTLAPLVGLLLRDHAEVTA